MDIDFDKLNSATKYPSIETYHRMAGGVLTEECSFTWEGTVTFTEKVDGTNSRIIRLPGNDYVIGSRAELLLAKGDRIGNPIEGIVEQLRSVADQLPPKESGDEQIEVYYLETYGGKIGAQARQYSARGAVAHRLFDVALIPVEVLGWPLPNVAVWRNQGGQTFVTQSTLEYFAHEAKIPQVPVLGTVQGEQLPTTREGMQAWLQTVVHCTHASIDGTGGGMAEGVVLRTHDRSLIAKARFADYVRALNPQQKKRR